MGISVRSYYISFVYSFGVGGRCIPVGHSIALIYIIHPDLVILSNCHHPPLTLTALSPRGFLGFFFCFSSCLSHFCVVASLRDLLCSSSCP